MRRNIDTSFSQPTHPQFVNLADDIMTHLAAFLWQDGATKYGIKKFLQTLIARYASQVEWSEKEHVMVQEVRQLLIKASKYYHGKLLPHASAAKATEMLALLASIRQAITTLLAATLQQKSMLLCNGYTPRIIPAELLHAPDYSPGINTLSMVFSEATIECVIHDEFNRPAYQQISVDEFENWLDPDREDDALTLTFRCVVLLLAQRPAGRAYSAHYVAEWLHRLEFLSALLHVEMQLRNTALLFMSKYCPIIEPQLLVASDGAFQQMKQLLAEYRSAQAYRITPQQKIPFWDDTLEKISALTLMSDSDNADANTSMQQLSHYWSFLVDNQWPLAVVSAPYLPSPYADHNVRYGHLEGSKNIRVEMRCAMREPMVATQILASQLHNKLLKHLQQSLDNLAENLISAQQNIKRNVLYNWRAHAWMPQLGFLPELTKLFAAYSPAEKDSCLQHALQQCLPDHIQYCLDNGAHAARIQAQLLHALQQKEYLAIQVILLSMLVKELPIHAALLADVEWSIISQWRSSAGHNILHEVVLAAVDESHKLTFVETLLNHYPNAQILTEKNIFNLDAIELAWQRGHQQLAKHLEQLLTAQLRQALDDLDEAFVATYLSRGKPINVLFLSGETPADCMLNALTAKQPKPAVFSMLSLLLHYRLEADVLLKYLRAVLDKSRLSNFWQKDGYRPRYAHALKLINNARRQQLALTTQDWLLDGWRTLDDTTHKAMAGVVVVTALLGLVASQPATDAPNMLLMSGILLTAWLRVMLPQPHANMAQANQDLLDGYQKLLTYQCL